MKCLIKKRFDTGGYAYSPGRILDLPEDIVERYYDYIDVLEIPDAPLYEEREIKEIKKKKENK